jgi:hypothetical protein
MSSLFDLDFVQIVAFSKDCCRLERQALRIRDGFCDFPRKVTQKKSILKHPLVVNREANRDAIASPNP